MMPATGQQRPVWGAHRVHGRGTTSSSLIAWSTCPATCKSESEPTQMGPPKAPRAKPQWPKKCASGARRRRFP
eukprot:15433399-Alexandrium_andersonii.AAC.1